MTLIDNWKAVLLKSWAMYGVYLSALFGALGCLTDAQMAQLLPLTQGFVTPKFYQGLSLFVLTLVPILRTLYQGLHQPPKDQP